MTEPQTITIDHVRSLLDADPGAIIGLIEGRVDVIAADRIEADDYRGALEVISRDDLVARLGDDASDEALSQQADALSTSVREIGG